VQIQLGCFRQGSKRAILYPWSGMVRRSGGQGNNILSAVFRQNHAYHSVIQLLRKRNRIQKKNLLRWGRWSRIYQWRVAPRCLSIFLLNLHLLTESKTASSYMWSSSAQKSMPMPRELGIQLSSPHSVYGKAIQSFANGIHWTK